MKKDFIPCNTERGFVLVFAVFVVALLSVWVLQCAQAALQFQLVSVATFEKKQAKHAARAGLEYCLLLLQKANQEEFQGEQAIASATFSYEVKNEDGKWDLNGLVDGDGNLVWTQAQALQRYLEKAGFGKQKKELIASLADWIDADSDLREGGAEARQDVPCANRALASASELCWVKGVHNLSQAQQLRGGITVYSQGKININTAPLKVIESLSDKISQPLAQTLVRQREKQPFSHVAALKEVAGITDLIYAELEDRVCVQGQYYTVVVEGHCGKSHVRLGAVAKRVQDEMKIIELREPLYEEALLD